MLIFDVDLTLINRRCFNVVMRFSFQRWYKDFNFSNFMIEEQNCVLESTQNKRCFNVNFQRWFNIDKLTLFRHWINVDIALTDVATLFQHISTLNQRWVFAGCVYGVAYTYISDSFHYEEKSEQKVYSWEIRFH